MRCVLLVFVHITERFYHMKQCPNTYLVVVIEDVEKSLVIGSATLVLEQKFIHNAAIVSSAVYFSLLFCC